MKIETVEVFRFPDQASVAGIGKAIIATSPDVDYNIPHQHFLVVKGFSEHFDALNLEYGLHFAADTAENAFIGSVERVSDYFNLNKVNTPDKFRKLIKEQNHLMMSDYWRVFRETEMELATMKKDLGSALYEDLRSKVKEEITQLEKREKNLLEKKSRDIVEDVKKFISEMQAIHDKRSTRRRLVDHYERLQYTSLEATQ